MLKPQTSASGCGVLSEADGSEAPALPIGSELAVRLRPAPHGMSELSSLCVAGGLEHLNVGAWIKGRGAHGWTDLELGTRLRWSIDTTFAIGIAPRLRSQWFRGFPSQHAVTCDVQAYSINGPLLMGIALRDVPIATPTARPFLYASAGVLLTSARVAFDLGMNASSELWIGLTTEITATDRIIVVGSVRTQPMAVSLAARIIVSDRHAIVCATLFQRHLGITPELTWSWTFAE